jgi:two-component system sensor histidine kinase/response regulator
MSAHLNLRPAENIYFPDGAWEGRQMPCGYPPRAGTTGRNLWEDQPPRRQLRATIRSLEQLAENKDERFGMLMHGLKNHLVGMQMSAEVLSHGDRPADHPSLKLMLRHISSSNRQMLSFVNEFLANSSADRRLVLKLEPVCFAAAVTRSVAQFQEAARRKNLVVRASPPGNGALVQADANALNQVLDNLLSNAVKFSPFGKQISVIVHPASSHVECEVRDQGRGFTADDKLRMFCRYEQLSARPTAGEASAGLGLSIVKKLVEAMHGQLFCESTAGCGASFRIRMPRPAA